MAHRPLPAGGRSFSVSHDASRTGAPMLLLDLLGWLRDHDPTCRRPSCCCVAGR